MAIIVLIIGVCGSGKTTIGQNLAKEMSWSFEDADNFHPASNIIKMQQGIPLTDKDRFPWLLALNNVVEKWRENSQSGVLTCSALKKSYRNIIFNGMNYKDQSAQQDPTPHSKDHLIVLLQGSKELIHKRMSKRQDHFMPITLLNSQLDILEPLEQSFYSMIISIDNTVEYITKEIVHRIEAIL